MIIRIQRKPAAPMYMQPHRIIIVAIIIHRLTIAIVVHRSISIHLYREFSIATI